MRSHAADLGNRYMAQKERSIKERTKQISSGS